MDLDMPDLDGLDTTRRIRQDDSLISQPHIISMTANVLYGVRDRCLESGMDDYLSKPILLDELEARLQEAVRRQNGRGVSPDSVA
jgi:CheY-like chemotaxis protein